MIHFNEVEYVCADPEQVLQGDESFDKQRRRLKHKLASSSSLEDQSERNYCFFGIQRKSQILISLAIMSFR